MAEHQLIEDDFTCGGLATDDERCPAAGYEDIEKAVFRLALALAFEYAHEAEVLLQILCFIGNTFTGLMQSIEDLYQQEQISQRVYARAKLLLRIHEQAQQ